MFNRKIIISLFFILFTLPSIAQNVNLDSLLDAEVTKKTKSETQFTDATFKTSRLINGHSVETTQKGVLDLKVMHRFGTLNEGLYNLYGLDKATMRIGVDYGITNRLSMGAGHSTFEKQYDGFLKYRLLWQSTGKRNMPVSVTLLSTVAIKTLKETIDSTKLRTSDRFYYGFQALIARKFNSAFSFQLMPTIIHYNLVPTTGEPNDLYALGAGTRLKLTKRTAITAEYYYQIPGHKLSGTYNSLSFGYEIETGGHVFQLHLSNSTGMAERPFITETRGKWGNGDIHVGFNISRVFTINRGRTSTDKKSNTKWMMPVDTASQTKSDSVTQYAIATFKTDHLINAHSVETTQEGILDVKVQHRFGTLNQGLYAWYGLDQATERIGFNYGISNRLTVGAGRSSFEKEYDGFIKYRLLWQSSGKRNMPVSVTLLAAASAKTLKETIDSVKIHTSDRFFFTYQAMIARKFGSVFSLQISPTLVHYNIVPASSLQNDFYSIGIGARVQITPRSSLLAEYFYQLPGNKLPGSYNLLSVGYEIETGGHVFHFHLTNSTGMTERTFITGTTGKWSDGDIHFGFNMSRVFAIKKLKTVN